MLSTCPSCLTQIDHADHLFEVTCECGTTFSPFLTPTDSHEISQGEASQATGSISMATDSFHESASMFQELRDFGETLLENTGNAPEPTPSHKKEAPPKKAEPVSSPEPQASAPALEGLITSGDSFSGYTIEKYFFPLSFLGTLGPLDDDPLKPLLQTLFEKTTSLGGNALISFQWAFAPQGDKVLLSAIPVLAKPNASVG